MKKWHRVRNPPCLLLLGGGVSVRGGGGA